MPAPTCMSRAQHRCHWKAATLSSRERLFLTATAFSALRRRGLEPAAGTALGREGATGRSQLEAAGLDTAEKAEQEVRSAANLEARAARIITILKTAYRTAVAEPLLEPARARAPGAGRSEEHT